MLWSLIKRTEWRPFLDLLSPSFFRVVPVGPLLDELRRLVSLYRSKDDFERARRERGASLERAGLPIRIASDLPPTKDAPRDSAAQGQRVLELYFHQIFEDGLVLLDLRRERFSPPAGDPPLVWSPSSAMANWTPTFRGAVRALYRGFYLGDDAVFREGLSALGLDKAEDALRRQFGEGDQRAVRFALKDFQAKFQDVFVRCQETDSRIDAAFLSLGLYLATLYEHLEALGEPFDVRAAFQTAYDRTKVTA